MPSKKLARIVSEIFNGFLTMILTPVLAVITSEISNNQKALLTITYLLIPLIPYFLLKKLGRITDYEITYRKQRPTYFFSITILFGLAHIFASTYEYTVLTSITLALFGISAITSMITLFWKISGHMTYSTLLFTTAIYLTGIPYLAFLFVFTPFIAWSRITLGKHTLTQVMLGTLIPLTISILIYWGFW